MALSYNAALPFFQRGPVLRARDITLSRYAFALTPGVVLACVVLITGCSPHAAPAADPRAVTAAESAPPPVWMRGVWTREWIDRRGKRSSTFDVHYLQTPTLYGDMRIPESRPSFAGATSFADLTDEQLRALAKQRGFTGRTMVRGLISTWLHDIDFQPADTAADIGRLERRGIDAMYEHAMDGSYVESWRRHSDGGGRFLAIRIEQGHRVQQTLLVSGDDFIYVRNRAHDLPAAESIDSLIAMTHADRAQIIAWLDCEFSTGRVRGGASAWEITRSTLPWREGKRLDFVDSVTVAPGGATPVSRSPAAGQWTVPVNTLSSAELERLFPAAH